jgi:hypothetical protein
METFADPGLPDSPSPVPAADRPCEAWPQWWLHAVWLARRHTVRTPPASACRSTAILSPAGPRTGIGRCFWPRMTARVMVEPRIGASLCASTKFSAVKLQQRRLWAISTVPAGCDQPSQSPMLAVNFCKPVDVSHKIRNALIPRTFFTGPANVSQPQAPTRRRPGPGQHLGFADHVLAKPARRLRAALCGSFFQPGEYLPWPPSVPMMVRHRSPESLALRA